MQPDIFYNGDTTMNDEFSRKIDMLSSTVEELKAQKKQWEERIWHDYHNSIFGPNGIILKIFKTEKEREAFYNSSYYQNNNMFISHLKNTG